MLSLSQYVCGSSRHSPFSDCTLVEHAKHRFEFLNKVASKHKAAMQTLLEKANARGPQLQGTIVAVARAARLSSVRCRPAAMPS
jgi:16S rRNA G527 N7-methylase RsmG